VADSTEIPTGPQHGLAKAVASLRVKQDLSYEQLAEQSGLAGSFLRSLEKGTNPTWGGVRKVARGLGVPFEEVVALAEKLEEADE